MAPLKAFHARRKKRGLQLAAEEATYAYRASHVMRRG